MGIKPQRSVESSRKNPYVDADLSKPGKIYVDKKFLPILINTKNLDSLFSLLDKKGLLPGQQKQKGITFSFAPTGNAIADRVNHPNQDAIILAPSLGFNSYDKLMVGGLITNYKLPPSRFQFLLTPMYAIGSKKIVGLGHLNYSFYTDKHVQKIQIGLDGLMFSKRASMDSM